MNGQASPTASDPTGSGAVGALSEEALLRVITAALAPANRAEQWPPGSVPPGDDAAVVPAPRGAVAVSTDAMGEGSDFLLTWPSGVRTRGYDAGWKAAAQNLSDINAMGARASALVTALTLPPETEVAWVRGFARGIVGALRALGATECRAAGGDLGTGERIQAAVTVLGDPHLAGVLARRPREADRARVRAEGADLVHAQASGHSGEAEPSGPGWAAAGLRLLFTARSELERRWHALPQAQRPGAREVARAVRGQLRPRPPLDAGPAAVDAGLLTLMDVSDGIGRDAHRMAAACGAPDAPLTAWVGEDWLAAAARPLARVAALAGVDAEALVLAGGEDYGVLGLAWPETELPAGFVRIGRLEPASAAAPAAAPVGHRLLPGGGWDHFGG